MVRTGEMKSTKSFVRKHEFRRSLGKFKHRWEDKIKCILKKQGRRVWTGFSSLRAGL